MVAVFLERSWEGVPAFFKPQDGQVTMEKFEIRAFVREKV